MSTAYEVDLLVLNEIDERGVCQTTVIFDVDDLDAAFAELDARYLAGEAAPHADMYRTWLRSIDLTNARDWDGVRAIWSDDLVVVDHRPGSFGVVEGRDAYQRLMQALHDLTPDIIVQLVAVHQLDAHGCVALARNTGTTVDGGAVEFLILFVCILRDGHITRVEFFPERALDEALRRFDELGPTPVLMLDNLCLQLVRRLGELTERRDWEAIALLYGDDIVFDDRRPGLSTLVTGREAMLVNVRAVQDSGTFETVDTPVAVRGNRCALFRVQFLSSAYDVQTLTVTEVDEHGVFQATVLFDVDDLDGAFAELEARYLAGEAAAHADAYRPVVAFRESYNQRDWDALGALLRDDFVGVDHRAAGWGTVEGRDHFVELMRGMVELAPDMTGYHAAIYELDAHGAVGLMRGAGTSLADSPVERLFLMTIIVRGGKVARMEFFAADALNEARARFRELDPSSAFVLDNLCLQLVRRQVELIERRDWEAIGLIWADNIVFDDRRPGMRTVTTGREAMLVNARATYDTETLVTPIAVRGERVALYRVQFVAPGYEVECLVVNDLDEHGVVRAVVNFEPDDLDGAFAELDARYLAGEGARFAPVIRVHAAAADAFNRRDWDALRAFDAPDIAIVDHRSGQFGMYDGRDDFIADIPAMIELTPDLRTRIVAVYPDHHGAVSVVHNTARTADGGPIENTMISVSVIENGVSMRVEYFAEDELAAARARLAELAPEPETAVPSNRAHVRVRTNTDAMIRHDAAAYRAGFAPEYRIDDRRSGVRLESQGHESSTGAVLRENTHIEDTLIATRGERLALFRSLTRGRTRDGFEWEIQVVWIVEINHEGLAVASVVFDVDDLASAMAELNARYLAGEGAPFESIIRLHMAVGAAVNRRDWDALRAFHASDVVFVDHRIGRLGLFDGRDDLLGDLPGITDVVANTWTRTVALHPAPHGIVALLHTGTTTDDGGHLEEPLVYLAIVEHGVITRGELFDDGNLDAARARLAELAPEPETGVPSNRAYAALGRSVDALVRHDGPAFDATHAPEWRNDDRRSGVRLETAGLDSIKAVTREVTDSERTLIATRGDRLALFHQVVRGETTAGFAWEIETLAIAEINDDDLITETVVLDPDDLDGALAELDARFLAGEGAPFEPVVRSNMAVVATTDQGTAVTPNRASEVMRVSIDALVRQDAAAFNATHRPGYRTDDRRSGVRLESDGMKAAVAWMRECTDADVTLIATRGDLLVLYRALVRGETNVGFPWEMENLTVMELNPDGLISATVVFDADDLDNAMAELDARYRAGERANAVPSNRVDAVVRVANAAMVRNDPAAFEALHAPGCRVQDRRSGVRLEDQSVESTTKGAVRDGTGVDLTLLASRGDLLAVHRSVFRGQTWEGFEWEIETLGVTQLNDDGLIAESVILDGNDLDAAMAELDARYLAGEGAPFEHVVRMNLAAVDAFNRRDWDALRTLYAPSIEMVDHRVVQFASYTNRDEFFRDVVTMVDVTPDLRMITAAIYPDHHGTVALVHHTATTADGGAIESMVIGVSVVHDGLITRLENFPENALNAARARLAELAPEQGQT